MSSDAQNNFKLRAAGTSTVTGCIIWQSGLPHRVRLQPLQPDWTDSETVGPRFKKISELPVNNHKQVLIHSHCSVFHSIGSVPWNRKDICTWWPFRFFICNITFSICSFCFQYHVQYYFSTSFTTCIFFILVLLTPSTNALAGVNAKKNTSITHLFLVHCCKFWAISCEDHLVSSYWVFGGTSQRKTLFQMYAFIHSYRFFFFLIVIWIHQHFVLWLLMENIF